MSIYNEDETVYLIQDEETEAYIGLSNTPDGPIQTFLVGVHKVFVCEDRHCAIHNNPSLHPLSMEPLVWDNNGAAVQRQCVHGVIHPDFDDLEYRKTVGQYYLYLDHDCDGCCGLDLKYE